MQLVYFYHRNQLHKLAKHPDFRFFEMAIWLHTVAHSLISVFVPILLYKSGYSINNIVIFYLIFNIIDIPLNFVAANIIKKIGARKGMMLGTAATIGFFGFLGILPPGSWWALLILAIFAAVYDTFFWVSHIYIFFETNRDKLDTGKSVGSLESIRKVASIVGPFIGALILIFFGKVSLTIGSILIFILSFIPLFKMRHVRDLPTEKQASFKQFFSNPEERKDYLSLALLGVHSEVDGILWPLFIFTVIGTIESVAAVPVIVAICTALFSYLAGKLTRKYGMRMIIVGSLVITCAWILRLTLESTPLYYGTIVLVGIFSLLVSIPLEVNMTTRALQVGTLAAATYRNTSSMLFRIPLYMALLVLLEVFKVSFILAASSIFAVVLVMLLIHSRRHYTS